MSLTGEAVLAVDDVTIEKVTVPKWGGDVFVRSLDSERQDAFEAAHIPLQKAGKATENMKARLGAYCMCDEKGNYLFGPDDIDALAKKSGGMLSRIAEVAWRINLFGDDAVKDMVENSDGDPSANTG